MLHKWKCIRRLSLWSNYPYRILPAEYTDTSRWCAGSCSPVARGAIIAQQTCLNPDGRLLNESFFLRILWRDSLLHFRPVITMKWPFTEKVNDKKRNNSLIRKKDAIFNAETKYNLHLTYKFFKCIYKYII